MKLKVFSLSMIALLALSSAGVVFVSVSQKNIDEVEAYTASSLPTTIDLNPTTSADIREYYGDLTSLDNSEKTGTNLLKHLKPILKNGQKYYSYESGENIWKMYEITDRDWTKSPATSISGYNPTTKIISNYSYRSSDPYIHALYVNRDVENQTTAWADHQQTQWGINREHVWPKSHGFDTDGAGGARGDPMHLWAGNGYTNNIHSNYYYGNVDKTKSYINIGSKYSNLTGNYRGTSKTVGSGIVFEPQDCDKGDIARAVFYMVARYNNVAGNDNSIDTNNPNLTLDNNINTKTGTSSANNPFSLGVLTDLLEWNRLDPPDSWEIQRNDLLYTNFTNNRNPFIDYPDWADYIWGDKAGVSYVDPNNDTIHNFDDGGGEEPPQQDVNVTGVSLLSSTTIKVGDSFVLVPEITPNNATNKNVSWATSDANVATVSNGRVTAIAVGTANITVTTQDQNKTATCIVTVVNEDISDSSVDTFALSTTGVSGSSYKAWSGPINGVSGAVYNGACAGGNSSIQLNNKKDVEKGYYAGIVTTNSPGYIKKVSVEWNSNTDSSRSITIYGKNTAYTGSSDLYGDASAKGQQIGTITKNSSTELTINNDYQYVGIYASSAVYLDSITFEWEIPVTGIEMDIDSLEIDLASENTAVLTPTIFPSNATNKNVIWYTSDADVASVSNGVVTANAVGEVYISAVAEDGQYEATCYINIIDSSEPVVEDVVVESSILAVKTANGWVDATAYATSEAKAVSLDENISFYTEGTGNNGKFYENGNNWRLYHNGNGNIVIKASNGCTIKSVILNFSTTNDGYLVDSESQTVESGQSYDVNNTSVTYTVGGPSNAQVRITNISVTYETNGQVVEKVLTSITISDYSSLFTVGETYRFDGIVTAHFDNETTQNVTGSASFSGYDMSEIGTQTVTVSYTYKEVTKTATYQITVEEAASSPYVNGIKYKLYFYNTNKATNYYFTGGKTGNNNQYGTTSSTYSDGVYVYFEQNGDGQNLYFMDNQTKKYISIVQNATYYNFTISEEAPASVWHYSKSYGCIYYVVNEKNYTIGTYSTYTTFATFDVDKYSTNYKPQFAETAETFSYEILNMISCDPTGNSEPRFRSGYSWSDLKTIYNRLDETEQNILKATDTNESGTITEQAMAKYEYIAGKYHLENFIAERTPKSFPYRYVSIEHENNNILLAILIIVATSAVAVGLYALIAKKKRK